MKLTPQQRKRLLIVGGAGGLLLAVVVMRKGAGSDAAAADQAAVGPLFDPSTAGAGGGLGDVPVTEDTGFGPLPDNKFNEAAGAAVNTINQTYRKMIEELRGYAEDPSGLIDDTGASTDSTTPTWVDEPPSTTGERTFFGPDFELTPELYAASAAYKKAHPHGPDWRISSAKPKAPKRGPNFGFVQVKGTAGKKIQKAVSGRRTTQAARIPALVSTRELQRVVRSAQARIIATRPAPAVRGASGVRAPTSSIAGRRDASPSLARTVAAVPSPAVGARGRLVI